jgi:glycosyltransferase involved in cell wall biosynthesis
VVREHACGVAIPPDDPEALAQAILALSHQRPEIDAMGLRGRQAAELHFAGPKVLEAMEASLHQIGGY